MKTPAMILAALSMLCLLAGCSPQQKDFGDKASDWKKTAPPPSWRGPGQPGGPPTSALSGPVSTPAPTPKK